MAAGGWQVVKLDGCGMVHVRMTDPPVDEPLARAGLKHVGFYVSSGSLWLELVWQDATLGTVYDDDNEIFEQTSWGGYCREALYCAIFEVFHTHLRADLKLLDVLPSDRMVSAVTATAVELLRVSGLDQAKPRAVPARTTEPANRGRGTAHKTSKH